jgi:ribosomal protein S6
MEKLLELVKEIAKKRSDGHYTILVFTTNYRGCYGTIRKTDDVNYLPSHNSLEDLLRSMIISPERHKQND